MEFTDLAITDLFVYLFAYDPLRLVVEFLDAIPEAAWIVACWFEGLFFK